VIPQAQPVIIDRVAGVINQEVITLSEVQEAVLQQASAASRASSAPAAAPGDPAFAARVLTPQALHEQLRLLIQTRLQLQAAEQRGLTVSDPELRQALDEIKSRNRFASDDALTAALASEGVTLEQYRQQLRKEILVAKLVNREVRSQVVVSSDEVQRYYAGHAEEFSQPQRVRIRQIFLAAPAENPQARGAKRAKAQEVLEQLQQGADFAQLARRYSDGPEAKEGGELGWFAQGSLAPELDRAAFTHQGETVSGLLESPAGYHLLKVEEREGQQRRPFEQVKEQLYERLLDERMRDRYEEWFLELRRNAYVDIRL
jgi:peptidyl-prolyl cis-trans isomerase SurA